MIAIVKIIPKRLRPSIFLLVLGFLFIIAGLLVIIFSQKCGVRLQPLECPQYRKIFV